MRTMRGERMKKHFFFVYRLLEQARRRAGSQQIALIPCVSIYSSVTRGRPQCFVSSEWDRIRLSKKLGSSVAYDRRRESDSLFYAPTYESFQNLRSETFGRGDRNQFNEQGSSPPRNWGTSSGFSSVSLK